jgi:hypothetical protein
LQFRDRAEEILASSDNIERLKKIVELPIDAASSLSVTIWTAI